MAKRETAPKTEEVVDAKPVDRVAPKEAAKEEVRPTEAPAPEAEKVVTDVKREVEPEVVAPKSERPSKQDPLPTRPTDEVPVTPRPTITTGQEVDAAFQLILDKLPKKAEFDSRTNRMLTDLIYNVTKCRERAKQFYRML